MNDRSAFRAPSGQHGSLHIGYCEGALHSDDRPCQPPRCSHRGIGPFVAGRAFHAV